ncbi:MAG: UDP-N-acetylglucosamine 2-epimerase [Nitrososphaerales archaeon]
MIHVFVGTKAQFIKMAPIMQELDLRGIIFNFIDSGQHAGLTGELIRQFGLREPNVFLRTDRTNINAVLQAVWWATKSLSGVIFRRKKVFQQIFQGEQGVCLIHGDTLTTLLSLFYAKCCGIRVAHVEAGLRSHDLLSPFPEEIIRRIAMRYGDILFAPSEWAAENLRKMGYTARAVNVGGNTVADAIRYARRSTTSKRRPNKPYVVATTHRMENIYSRSRLTKIATLLERIAKERQVIFVIHEPTQRQLLRYGLEEKLLRQKSIEMLPLQSYIEFIDLLAGADFVVTDGGSIQEESYFLNIPCLIMRNRTERREGLGQNAFVTGFDEAKIDQFLEKYSSFRRTEVTDDSYPSRTIVDHLLSLGQP